MQGEDVIKNIASHIAPKKRAKLSVGVLASGNGSNLQAMIDFSKTKDCYFEIHSVICNTPGSFALERAKHFGIDHHLVDHRVFGSKADFESRLMAVLIEANIELIVLAGFMRILSPSFLMHFPNRVINLHPSLLPKHRGLDAINQAIKAGDTVAGCTVHLVDFGLDTGPIIAQSNCPIFLGDDLATVKARIKALEHSLLPQVVNQIAGIVVRRDFV